MISPQLQQHVSDEIAHIVQEMHQAGVSWSDIVETLESLVLQQMWHLQGFIGLILSGWFS